MADSMEFPKTIEEFLDDYSFKDKEEVYTNGSVLIPLFRVKQGLEHYMQELNTTINRQKAEIIRLKGSVVTNNIMEIVRIKKQAKSEALMHAFSKFAGHSDYHGDTILCQLTCMAEGEETKSATPIDMNKIKSKAIKEFAERLKEHSFVDNLSLDGKETVYVDDIDNLVKEMTEEKSDV